MDGQVAQARDPSGLVREWDFAAMFDQWLWASGGDTTRAQLIPELVVFAPPPWWRSRGGSTEWLRQPGSVVLALADPWGRSMAANGIASGGFTFLAARVAGFDDRVAGNAAVLAGLIGTFGVMSPGALPASFAAGFILGGISSILVATQTHADPTLRDLMQAGVCGGLGAAAGTALASVRATPLLPPVVTGGFGGIVSGSCDVVWTALSRR